MPLSDRDAYDALHRALTALGREPGATVHADTALAAARRSLAILQLGLLKASEKD